LALLYEQLALLWGLLERLPLEEVIDFQHHLYQKREDAYREDLWGAAYLMGGGCGDDGFMDFRSWLISRGRQIYMAAISNPDSLALLADPKYAHPLEGPDRFFGEKFGMLAHRVYESRVGKCMPYRRTGGLLHPRGEKWDFRDEAEMARRYPALWKLHGSREE
jgi:hypothetical protein